MSGQIHGYWPKSEAYINPTTHLVDIKVSHLFGPVNNIWNHRLTTSHFNSRDAADLLNIPLHSRADHDAIAWKAYHHRMYPVKSAYKICMDVAAENDPIGEYFGSLRLCSRGQMC
jgi:hypothetical protein